ncbi:MAG TPA: PaaI family thioesterase [Azospirillaceae bacterium]|nr:PaaI family thioesterase [Azospirillaceae bacterium]
MITASGMRGLTGIEAMRRMMSGDIPAPPIMHLLDFSLVDVEEGRVVFAFVPAEFHYNPIGSVHGGIFATLLDSAMGCAVHTVLPAGMGYTTLEFKVNMTRPLTATTGEVRCEGSVINRGRQTAVAEARIVDKAGKIYAHSTTTCLLFPV